MSNKIIFFFDQLALQKKIVLRFYLGGSGTAPVNYMEWWFGSACDPNRMCGGLAESDIIEN